MAGLIPQNFIDDLLARLDIVDVVESRVKLRKTGKNYAGLCPFHQEKSPSFTVEPEKQFYYCFGCGAAGNAIGFVMNYENLDFPQAIENLAQGIGLEVPREQSAGNRSQPPRQDKRQPLYDTLKQAALFYQAQLRRHPQAPRAIDYLKSRALSGEIARDFGLGFAPPGWDNLLQALGGSPEQDKLLLDSGLLIEKEGGRRQRYDRFRDRIVYPIRDSRGRVIGFGGRVLGDDKPKYLNSPETEVFHKGSELYGLYEARRKLRQMSRILIVEGYMDVIALAQHGIHYAVATLGTATSATHLQRLFKLVPEVVFCFDGDEAGRNAAWRALQQALPLMEDGRQARFLFLPEGEDPDSQVRKVGAQTFTQSLERASGLAEYFFEALGRQVDMNSLEGRARLGSLALPHIKQLPQGIFRQLMTEQLSRIAGTDIQALATEGGPDTNHAPPALPQDSQPAMPRLGRRSRETGLQAIPPCLRAVNLILLNPALVEEQEIATALAPEAPFWQMEAAGMPLLLQVLELARQAPGSKTYQLLARVYGTPLGSQLTQLLKREQITPREGAAAELRDIIRHLHHSHEKQARKDSLLAQARQRLAARRQPAGDEKKSNFS